VLPSSRDRTMPPICPFCRQRIKRPVELEGLWFEFDGGVCDCGAHYTLDPTTRNGGAVMLQALVQACGGDWDLALTKAPGVDYEEAYLGRYNALTHRVGGNAFGTLYFIRLRPGRGEQESASRGAPPAEKT
jgi:hypothetical protein